jgi:RNA methyltransferase, TrmH family
VLALQRSTRRRLRDGLMVAEGLRLLQELCDAALPIVELFASASFRADDTAWARLVAALPDEVDLVAVPDEIMAAMSDTVTPQGVLAVLPIPRLAPAGRPRLVLVPDQVRDPGNLGTILRTSWAAGVTQVLLPAGSVDHTNPKVVRAGMGAHFHLPIVATNWEAIWDVIGEADVWLAEAGEGRLYDVVDWRGEVALIIGGEATGASAGARGRGACVQIPMARGVESLNAAIAAGILLFEAARQRRASMSGELLHRTSCA